MKTNYTLPALLLFAALFCGISTGHAIVHGHRVSKGSVIAQSTVALYNNQTESFCTGTIIDPHWVLTAAHCLTKKWQDLSGEIRPRDLTIIFGEFNSSSGNSSTGFGNFSAKSSFIVKHPDFGGVAKVKTSERNDIALIRFDSNLPKHFKSVAMLSESDFHSFQAGMDVTIAGYGITSVKDDSTIKNLYSFSEVYQSTDDKYKVVKLVPYSDKPGGNCPGDSGGPAFIEIQGETYVWGVASTAEKSCMKFGEYVNISVYADWVSEVMNKYGYISKK
jgi:secreted trypsin-like serine protease